MIYACGGAVSLAAGATAVGIFGLPAPWAVAIILALLMAAVFEGGYRANARLRSELEVWEARAVNLPAAMEALLREGAGMLILFPQEAPVAGEEGAYAGELFPPSTYKEQVSAFTARIRALLMEQRPSLLPTFAAGSNDFLERAREKQDAREQRLAEADAAVRLRELADFNHRWPAVELEACLRGLSDARNQLGHDDRVRQSSRSRAS